MANELEEHTGPNFLKDVGFSVVHPFFNERARFDLQFNNWLTWPDEVKERVHIVIADDCSPSPVHSWMTKNKLKYVDQLNLDIYRITTDLKHNTPGALNLAFDRAPDDFVLTMDSDCAFKSDQIVKFLDANPREDTIYKFNRSRIGDPNAKGLKDAIGYDWDENLGKTRYLNCSMLMHKNVFSSLSGFDEDFTGARSNGYGYFDNDFDRRANLEGYPMYVWEEVVATEWMPSVSNGEVASRTGREQRRNVHLMRRKAGGYYEDSLDKHPTIPQNRDILRFDWEKTFSSRRKI
jgi:glycosyltransferase involved in cell wall biosynthesis